MGRMQTNRYSHATLDRPPRMLTVGVTSVLKMRMNLFMKVTYSHVPYTDPSDTVTTPLLLSPASSTRASRKVVPSVTLPVAGLHRRSASLLAAAIMRAIKSACISAFRQGSSAELCTPQHTCHLTHGVACAFARCTGSYVTSHGPPHLLKGRRLVLFVVVVKVAVQEHDLALDDVILRQRFEDSVVHQVGADSEILVDVQKLAPDGETARNGKDAGQRSNATQ